MPTTDPIEVAALFADVDERAELRSITDEQAADLKVALLYLIDAKIAHKRDDDPVRGSELAATAQAALERMGVPGVVLYGDLGGMIVKTRVTALAVALQKRAQADA